MKTRNRITLALLSAAALILGIALWNTPAATSAPEGNPVELSSKHALYTQPGAKGIAGLKAWEEFTGQTVAQMTDFTGTASWAHISRYLPFTEWAKLPQQGKRLLLTVAMLPADTSTNLAACANGDYNVHWQTLGQNLVTYGLEKTVVRPGHEMNGGWYRWNARGGKELDYAGCFRQVVTTMRAVPGQKFLFDWSVANATTPPFNLKGERQLDYDKIWPGDEYVDVVGVDVYDYNYNFYPIPASADEQTVRTVQRNSWLFQLGGNYQITEKVKASPVGLVFWRDWAKAHGKPMSIDETGVAWKSDGYAGGDNPLWIDRIVNFAADPANNVAWLTYFNIDVTGVKHDLLRADTYFPQSAERIVSRVSDLAR